METASPRRSLVRGPDKYPITAYSEFMPPPRLGLKAYCEIDMQLFPDDDPWGWHVTEYEEAFELQPGFELIARQLVHALRHLGCREPAHGISPAKLKGNPYWPPELRDAPALAQERYVMLLPLALSRTQDDKGRVRWTLFGASEQGPARGFWKSFFTAPGEERPNNWGPDFFRRLLSAAYSEPAEKLVDLHEAGLRIMPTTAEPGFPALARRPTATAGPSRCSGSRAMRSAACAICSHSIRLRSCRPELQKAYLVGPTASAPISRQLGVLGRGPLSASSQGAAAGDADSAAALDRAARSARRESACRSRAGCTSRIPTSRRSTARTARCATRSIARTAGPASIGTTTNWLSATAKTTWPTCCSAPRPTTSASTASRWPATAQIWTRDCEAAARRPASDPP